MGSEAGVWTRTGAAIVASAAGTMLMAPARKLVPARQWVNVLSGRGSRPGYETHGTEVLAGKIARSLGVRLGRRDRKRAGKALHWAFGLGSGALFGLLGGGNRCSPWRGLALGLTLFAGADEGLVPAIGLGRARRRIPPEMHLRSLAAHVAYGLSTGLLTCALQRVLSQGRRREG